MKFATIFLILLSTLWLAAPLRAATFTVSKLADTNDGVCDADCSLREAITAANNAAGEEDKIVFAETIQGIITLLHGELTINRDVSITGPGADL